MEQEKKALLKTPILSHNFLAKKNII